jgi:competence protein ComEC
MAVLSLLLFYRYVYHWFFIFNRSLDAVWKLMAGTIAAQILTFPLCVYYFHQFPLLFLFTNLIAVPATTIILYAEIALIAFSWIKPFAMLLGAFISQAIHWLNEAVFFTGHLSFAVLSGLQISLFQMMLLFGIVFLSAYWLMKKKPIFLPAAMGTLLLLICSFTFERMHRLQQKKFIVYAAQKQQAIEFIKGEQYFSPDEKALAGNVNTKRYVIQPARLFTGVNTEDSSVVKRLSSASLDLFQFEGKIIARVKQSNFKCALAIHTDYLILSGKCRADADWIRSNFTAKQIVLDSSVPFWKTSDFKRQLAPSGIPIHVVGEDGAFEVGL